MITGFNTDVEFDGVTYHIQTEDKGITTPIILSLVYDRGTILASKRTPYDDLLAGGLDEKLLSERLQKQHKTICAAVRKGRIEELKHMSDKPAVAMASTNAAVEVQTEAKANGHSGVTVAEEIAAFENAASAAGTETAVPNVSNPIPYHPGITYEDEPLIEGVTIFEDDIVVPVEAVAIVSDLAGTERPENSRLTVEFIGESRFKGGQERSVMIMVCRSSQRKVVSDAEIMIKILGTSFRPQIFHARTDQNGIARLDIQLPSFRAGRATLVVRAMSNGEEVELRRAVTHDES